MTTLSRLIEDVAERTGIMDVPANLDLCLPMAETKLSRMLRAPEMETSATLTTDANGEVALPADLQSERTVRILTVPLRRLPLPDIQAGHKGYAVRGSTMVTNSPATDIELEYFARLPDLLTNGTNWLLTSQYEVYLVALSAEFLTRAARYEEATAAANYARDLVAAINMDGVRKRLSGTRMTVAGETA